MSPALSAPQSTLVPQQELLSDDWKQEITERLDRYRAHRPHSAATPSSSTRTPVDSRATKIARAVASRYATAPTYSELIAAETARAEALMAEQRAQQAKEAVESAGTLFQDLNAGNNEEPSPSNYGSEGEKASRKDYAAVTVPEPTQPTVPGTAVLPQFAVRSREMHLHQAEPEPEPSLEDLLASSLVEPRAMLPSKLIEFPRELISPRRARPHLPEDPTRAQATAYPEESPAQLRIFEVQPETEAQTRIEAAMSSELQPNAGQAGQAQRKAIEESVAGVQNSVSAAIRPAGAKRASDGADALPIAPSTTRQHVNESPAQRSSTFKAQAPSTTMPPTSTATSKSARANSSASSATASSSFRGLEWASISLDKEPAAYARKAQPAASEYLPFMVDPASIDRRVMAFAVDFAAVTAGFMGFLVVFVASTPHLPTGLTAAALAGVVYVALWVLYQMLFFSLGGATAGMLYAHIALCTFDDQNPTRSALQRRLAAWWVSLLPLGIGFLWCFVDEDNLCWHDRITRTYQRAY
ncbi:MAG TPA: RDD family protein [Acidobacteriaceae bacterium]|nr:RDD family protein [Acidobacteriaceae bacterium]